MLSFLGPYHPTFSFISVCLNAVPSTKPLSRGFGDVGSEREYTHSRWTLTIFQNYVGDRQRLGRDTDVKSCTHAHIHRPYTRENTRARTHTHTHTRTHTHTNDHSELYCSVNGLMCSELSCETNECVLGELPDTIIIRRFSICE